jgi:hypothetical protein
MAEIEISLCGTKIKNYNINQFLINIPVNVSFVFTKPKAEIKNRTFVILQVHILINYKNCTCKKIRM